jgi:hypothetical protein
MQKTVVINIVGLSTSVIGEHTPFLQKYITRNSLTLIKPAFLHLQQQPKAIMLQGKIQMNMA